MSGNFPALVSSSITSLNPLPSFPTLTQSLGGGGGRGELGPTNKSSSINNSSSIVAERTLDSPGVGKGQDKVCWGKKTASMTVANSAVSEATTITSSVNNNTTTTAAAAAVTTNRSNTGNTSQKSSKKTKISLFSTSRYYYYHCYCRIINTDLIIICDGSCCFIVLGVIDNEKGEKEINDINLRPL